MKAGNPGYGCQHNTEDARIVFATERGTVAATEVNQESIQHMHLSVAATVNESTCTSDDEETFGLTLKYYRKEQLNTLQLPSNNNHYDSCISCSYVLYVAM